MKRHILIQYYLVALIKMGDILAKKLAIKNVMAEWNIAHKVTASVSNNAPNILSAVRLGDWQSSSCFAHCLNLVVQEAMIEINDVLGRVKNIVEFFNRSSQPKPKLASTQHQMNMSILKLKQDIQTRWNSTFHMLKRIVQVKDAVIVTLALLRPDLSLNEEECEIIEGVLPLLIPFFEITIEISAEKNVSLSKEIGFCSLLKSSLQKHILKNKQILAAQSVLRKGMDDLFKDIEHNVLLFKYLNDEYLNRKEDPIL